MGCVRRMEVVVLDHRQALATADFPLPARDQRRRSLIDGCSIALLRTLRRTRHNWHREGRRRQGTRLCRRCLRGLRSHRLPHHLSQQAPDQRIVALSSAYWGTSTCPLPRYSVAPQARHHGHSSEGRGMPIVPCSARLAASRCSSHQTAGC